MRDELLKLAQVREELKVARSTYNKWCALGIAPRSIKLPNGERRVRRSVLDEWIANREDIAA